MTSETSKPTSEPKTVIWTKIPIIGLPELACAVPVDIHGDALDGDREPLPLEDRPNPCGADGTWMIGSVAVCARHFPEVAEMCGDNAADIERAWRDQLNGL